MTRLALLSLLFAGTLALAQTTPAPASAPPTTQPHGAVVISSDHLPISAAPQDQPSATAAHATDAERRAVTITRYALDLRLTPRDSAIAVRASLTVRNDSATPLTRLPLQLSSTLHWSSARLANGSGSRALPITQYAIDSDADHTGKLTEAVLQLPEPLAYRADLTLDVIYSGAIPQDSTRLTRIGTPPDLAAHSDWDSIAPAFTGLRGFGNVVWYPVSSVPVALGDGDKLFAAIGDAKLRASTASLSLSVTAEVYGPLPTLALSNVALPNVALLDGVPVPLTTVVASTTSTLPSIVTCTLPAGVIGFRTPSVFLATRTAVTGNNLHLYARDADLPATQSYLTAASMVTPQLQQWLGEHPKDDLTVLDLAAKDDAPFEDRQALYTGLDNIDPKRLTSAMSHALSHAFFVSDRPWLAEGVAGLMASLFTEQTHGREQALTELDNLRSSLALAEPANPDAGGGQSLIGAHDAVYYRTKAVYVLWMLRALVGDPALISALHSYRAADDTTDAYFQQLVEQASHRKLDWFFAGWVYRDRGLPDLSITGVYPNHGSAADSYIVAVTVSNSGYAAAEVPVTVTSAAATVTERLLVPARGSATHRILIQGQPAEVQVNDGAVPEVVASIHRNSVTHLP